VKRKRTTILTVFLAVLFIGLGFGFTSYAMTGGTNCTGCHIQFEIKIADPVTGAGRCADMSACRKCHGYPGHGSGDIIQRVETPYGWFAYADSPNYLPSKIHSAHDGYNGGYNSRNIEGSACTNCHATVDCNTCHLSVDHTLHGNVTPVRLRICDSTSVYDKDFTCAHVSCHYFSQYEYGIGRYAITTLLPRPPCSNCHLPSPDYHGDVTTPHTYTAMPTDCMSAGCHTNVLTDEHGKYTYDCNVCHGPDARQEAKDAIANDDVSCGACHGTIGEVGHYALHEDNLQGLQEQQIWECADCHKNNLMDEHDPRGYTCSTCHGSTDEFVQNAISSGDTSCIACHPTHPDFSQASFCYKCHPSIKDYFTASLNVSAQHQVECTKCHGYHKNTEDQPFSNPDNLIELYTATVVHPATGATIPNYIDFCNRCHDNQPPAGVNIGTLRNIDSAWRTSDVHGSIAGGLTKAGKMKSVAHLSLPYKRGLAALPCNDCHASHGSKNIYHFVETQTVTGLSDITVLKSSDCWRADGKGICQACHTWMHPTTATATKGGSKHKTTSTDCLSCHFHGATKVISCGACHDLF